MLGYHIPIPKSSITPQPAPFRIPLLMDVSPCFKKTVHIYIYIYIRQSPFLTIVVPSLILASTKIRSPHPQQNKRFEQLRRENNLTIWPIISRWPDQHPLPEKLPASMPASFPVRLQFIQRRKTRGKSHHLPLFFVGVCRVCPENFGIS